MRAGGGAVADGTGPEAGKLPTTFAALRPSCRGPAAAEHGKGALWNG